MKLPADHLREGLAELRLLAPSMADDFLSAEPYRKPWTEKSFNRPLADYRQAREISQVKRDDFLADLEFLEELLTTAYPGWRMAEEVGLDPATHWAEWRRDLRKQAVELTSPKAFRGYQTWQAKWPDVHTGPVFTQLLFAQWTDTVWDHPNGKNRVVRPGYDRSEQRLRDITMGVQISLELVNPAARDIKPTPSFRISAGNLGICALPTMERSALAGLRRFLNPMDLDQCNRFVLDLRGNPGGDLMSTIEVLNRLFPGVEFWAAVRASFSVSQAQPIHIALRVGHTLSQIARHRPPYEMNLRIGLANQLLRQSFPTTPPKPASPFPDSAKRLPFPVIVLIDGRTASDAELLAWTLKRQFGAMLAGAVTAGATRLVQPGAVLLPRTGVLFRLATGVLEGIPAWSCGVGAGLVPDILIDGPVEDGDLRALFDLATTKRP